MKETYNMLLLKKHTHWVLGSRHPLLLVVCELRASVSLPVTTRTGYKDPLVFMSTNQAAGRRSLVRAQEMPGPGWLTACLGNIGALPASP